MITYSVEPLHTRPELHDRMMEIVEAVNVEIEKDAYSPEHLKASSKRGDVAVLAFDDDELIGFALMSKADYFLAEGSTFHLKLWLAQNGYDFNRLGASHMVYLHPNYWKQGLNAAMLKAREGSGFFDFLVAFRPATQQLMDWVMKQPNVINTGLLDEMGFPILIRDIR